MPVLAFVPSLSLLVPSPESVGRRTLIQVSEAARDRIAPILSREGLRMSAESVPILQGLAAAREFDAELALLISAIERDGAVYATFI